MARGVRSASTRHRRHALNGPAVNNGLDRTITVHYSLGQIKSPHRDDSTPRLVLLKGADFSSLKPGIFFLPLREKDEVLRVHGAAHR